jgi:hypothetical protein
MHSNRLRVEQADAGLSNTRATELRAYLDRLIDTLDDSSLRAVLKLMICETRGAVCKQRQLIALQRLDGRAAGGHMQRLRELEAAQKHLTAVYASNVATEDDGTDDHGIDDQGLDESAAQMSYVEERGAPTRTATASSVHAFMRLGTIGKKQGAYVGRLSAAALEGEPARAEPAPVRDRQGRHGAGPPR